MFRLFTSLFSSSHDHNKGFLCEKIGAGARYRYQECSHSPQSQPETFKMDHHIFPQFTCVKIVIPSIKFNLLLELVSQFFQFFKTILYNKSLLILIKKQGDSFRKFYVYFILIITFPLPLYLLIIKIIIIIVFQFKLAMVEILSYLLFTTPTYKVLSIFEQSRQQLCRVAGIPFSVASLVHLFQIQYIF